MGLYIKKIMPFSIKPIESYLKITDVYFKADKINIWQAQYVIFLNKEYSDLIKTFLYIRTSWLPDAELIIPPIVEYIDEKLTKPVTEIIPSEEKIIDLPFTEFPFQFSSFDELMQKSYDYIKSLSEFNEVKDDLESWDEFNSRKIIPLFKEFEKIKNDYNIAIENEHEIIGNMQYGDR